MKFEDAVKVIFANEGGYLSPEQAAKIGDTGGETYRGIARNHNPQWNGWPLVDQIKKQKGGSIPWNYKDARLDELAMPLFKTKYWEAPGIEKFPARLHLLIFDAYANTGGNTFGILSEAAGLQWKNDYTETTTGTNNGNIKKWNLAGMIKIAQSVTPEAFTQARIRYHTNIARGRTDVLNEWITRTKRVLAANPAIVTGAGIFFLAAAYVAYNYFKGKKK